MKVTVIAPEEKPVTFDPGSIWQRDDSGSTPIYVMVVVLPSMPPDMIKKNTVWYVYLSSGLYGTSDTIGALFQRSEAEFRSMFTLVGTPVELKVQP